MTHMPKLAIVGRPNVGKSALFNRICNERIAIVDEAEGITRDRLYAEGELFGFRFQVIDTGGIDARSKEVFNEEIKRQAEIAIEEADAIIQVVDAQIGMTELDKEVAEILLKTKKPVCLAVNKIDDISQEHLLHHFYSTGISPVISVSAIHGWHLAELLEAALGTLIEKKSATEEEATEDPNLIKVAVVGRPNVGKSSLVNYLLEDERCIVSPIAGTTRDSVDVSFVHEDQNYTLIDTAGIRRKKSEHEVVDKFAFIRTKRAVERAQICLLMLDAQEGLTAQDKKIANMIEESGKCCIILFNKWDLISNIQMEHYLKTIELDVPFLKYCPKLFISAKTGRNVETIFSTVQHVYQQSQMRITTHQLNKFLELAMQRNHPPMLQGKRLRVYYMAQVSIAPPKFIFFVNNPLLMTETYKKYLYNQFREVYQFSGVPLLFHLKGKQKRDKPEPSGAPSLYDHHRRPEEEVVEGEEDESMEWDD
jgi:GTP-binding protein